MKKLALSILVFSIISTTVAAETQQRHGEMFGLARRVVTQLRKNHDGVSDAALDELYKCIHNPDYKIQRTNSSAKKRLEPLLDKKRKTISPQAREAFNYYEKKYRDTYIRDNEKLTTLCCSSQKGDKNQQAVTDFKNNLENPHYRIPAASKRILSGVLDRKKKISHKTRAAFEYCEIIKK